jgi:hypothetical protein
MSVLRRFSPGGAKRQSRWGYRAVQCKICGEAAQTLFAAKILGRHDVDFRRCVSCGFIQTDEPYWLDEAYSSAILDIDLGPVDRAMRAAPLIEGIVLSHFDPSGPFIDFGGGYGVLARLMRDKGFDFYWHDRYCENLFAKQFRAQEGKQYELLTAFEVFEHLPDPIAEIERMLAYAPNILFSTQLVPPGVKTADDWWYFAPRYGQHVSFFTPEALRRIGERFRLHVASDGFDTHLLSRKPVSDRALRFFTRRRLPQALARKWLRRRLPQASLLHDDFRSVTEFKL